MTIGSATAPILVDECRWLHLWFSAEGQAP